PSRLRGTPRFVGENHPSTPDRIGRRSHRRARSPWPRGRSTPKPFRSPQVLRLPPLADRLELALDRAQAAIESRGDLLVRVAFHPHESDLAERVVLQSFETEPELLGDHRREFGARLVAHDLGKAQAGIRVCSLEHRLTEHVAAAALQLMFAPDLV